MGLRDFFRRRNEPSATPDHAEMVARYKRLRALGKALNHKLVQRLSKDVLQEGGRKLGMLKNGILIFDSKGDTAILMDYCIYNVRRKGRNAVEQYLLDSPPAPESDEMALLRAMQRAVYSLFIVESATRGLGVTVRDLLSNASSLVVDMGLGRTGQPGHILATRLLFHERFAMTGGAALPLGMLPEGQQQSWKRNLAGAAVRDDIGYFDPASIIRTGLSRGCASHVRYQDPSGRLVARQGAPKDARSTGRNDPCPCGSGAKFKNCCNKRR